MKIRKAAVAGTFYPEDPDTLRSEVVDLLSKTHPHENITPKILIVPHAGYPYSGPTAAEGYSLLKNIPHKIDTVVLLGPTHRFILEGIGMPTAEFFQTPLGDIPIDHERLNKIKHMPFTQFSDSAHECEHSLEVHLPFLQTLLKGFKLVPLVAGKCTPDNIDKIIETLWDDKTLIICSTDLSHFLSHKLAQRIDKKTSASIINFQNNIKPEQACGCSTLNGVLTYAKRHHLSVEGLDLRTSGDTAGPKDRVVGYGAYAIY